MEQTLNRVYELIKERPLHWNSVMLGKELGVENSNIRRMIMEINSDTEQFEYGIISVDQKYKLATDINDIQRKVSGYIAKHKHLLKMETLWNQRSLKLLNDHNEDMVQGKILWDKWLADGASELFETEEEAQKAYWDTVDGETSQSEEEFLQDCFILENEFTEEEIETFKKYERRNINYENE